MNRAVLLVCMLCFMKTTFASQPSILENEFPKVGGATLSFIEHFPALANLLSLNHPWTESPQKFKKEIFSKDVVLAQGSNVAPLIYTGRRSNKWHGEPIWSQVAYETEYYVFDPARPVIRFHIGRPLDIRMQTLDHKHVDEIRSLYPLLADSVRTQMATFIHQLIEALKPYGAKELDFKHPRIHKYLLPGGTN